MDLEEREELKREILNEMELQENQIESLKKSVKPVAPDNAIGRLTRMEAIGSKAISEASLNSSRVKLAKLGIALEKIDDPGFGVRIRCSSPIPKGRILLLPESVVCVPCAEAK